MPSGRITSNLSVSAVKLIESLYGPAGTVSDPVILEITERNRESTCFHLRYIRTGIKVIAQELVRLACLKGKSRHSQGTSRFCGKDSSAHRQG